MENGNGNGGHIAQNGSPPQVNGRAISLLRNLTNGERDAALAALVGTPVLLTDGQVAVLGGSTSQRIAKARNGAKPKRPKPSRKTLDDLGYLMAWVEDVTNAACWWNDDYRNRELGFLARAFCEWAAQHPDFQWPATLAKTVNALGAVICTIVEVNRRNDYR
jgi:hypothetical protein